MDVKHKLGLRIKTLRKLMHITQEELAEKANISVTFVGLTERGINIPSIKTCEKIANAFGITLSELFKFDNTNEQENAITQLNSYLKRCKPEEVLLIKDITERFVEYKKNS